MNNIHQIQLIKDIKRDHGTYLVDKLIDKLQFIILPEKECLYSIGDIANKFYILLTGRLEVFMSLEENNYELRKIKEILQQFVLYRPIKQFGEAALFSGHCKRHQTIKALQTSQLAYLSRQDYNQLIGKYQQDNLESKIKLLIRLECFNSWTMGQLKNFSCYLYQMNFCLNQILYKENETSDFLYIVKDGQFEMIKTITESFKRQRLKNSTICLLNEGQIFGEESLMLSIHSHPIIVNPTIEEESYINRYATVKCVSITGSLFRVSRQDIIERCWDEQTKQQFLSLLNNLKNFRLQRGMDLQNNNSSFADLSNVKYLTEPESVKNSLNKSPKLEPIFTNTFFQKYYQSQQQQKMRSISTVIKVVKQNTPKNSNPIVKKTQFQRLLSQRYQKSTIKQEMRCKSFDLPLNKFGYQYYKQFLVSERLKSIH